MQPPSQTAVVSMQLLLLFAERKLSLTRGDYDAHFDNVLAALEAANNETFRLRDDSPDEVP